jgi:hypothetical protein
MGLTEGIQSAAITACGVVGAAVSETVLPGSSIVLQWLTGMALATIGGGVVNYMTTPRSDSSGGNPGTPNSSDVKNVAKGTVDAAGWLFQSLPYPIQGALLTATAIYGWQKWKAWSAQKNGASDQGNPGGSANVTVNVFINGQEKTVSRV